VLKIENKVIDNTIINKLKKLLIGITKY